MILAVTLVALTSWAMPPSRVLAAVPTTSPATQPGQLTAGDHVRHVTVDARDRSYRLHIPKSLDLKNPQPLVLAFHGAFTNAVIMEAYSALDAKADAAGFIVAYPNGTGPNDLTLFFNIQPAPNLLRPDDIAFTSRVIDDIEAAAPVDPKRVYATGISNGGMFCYLLASQLSNRIAAIAPVSGTMTTAAAHPKRPVSIIDFHGTADPIVAYNGPANPNAALFYKSVQDSIAVWLKIDACPATPSTTQIPDTAKDGTTVRRDAYGPGKTGDEVVLYTIINGGHTWPNRPTIDKLLGPATHNINANDLIWDFFVKHPMP
jgi:polyhydroxybutyrate depolymerase